MCLNKRGIALATAGVFILLAAVYAITANNAYMRDHLQAITKAELTAKVYTGDLERDFHQGISVTKALEDVIINGEGRIQDFTAASEMDQTFTTAQGKTYTYTISVGYSDYPAQARTREELARNVDCALYNVKLSGKHGCQRFVPGMVKKSREQLGFSQNELLKSLPGSGIICHADDNRILYANDDFVRLFECENLEDFNRFSLGLFRNLIHPGDYERVMKERCERFVGKSDGDQIRLHFRIVTKSGKARNVVAQARLRHHEMFGDLHFVTCMDLDGE